MTQHFDLLVRGGTVFDGTGAPGRLADVGVLGDRIAAIGDLAGATADTVVEAAGRAVAPASSTSTPMTTGRCCPTRTWR